MRKEDRYMLREKKIPYVYDEVLTRNPSVSLKMFEIFDGKEVKWGVREEFVSTYDDRVCKSTPLLENIVDEDGRDIDRIIYLGDSKFLLYGKINNSEVFCQINNNSTSEDDFYELQDFGGKDVKISIIDRDTAIAKVINKYSEPEKFWSFNYRTFQVNNVFDAVDKENVFLKSYFIHHEDPIVENDETIIRSFVGITNDDGTEVKPYGYDFNYKNNKYFRLPLNEYNQIDEKKLREYAEKTSSIGVKIKRFTIYDDTFYFISRGFLGEEIKTKLKSLNKEKSYIK